MGKEQTQSVEGLQRRPANRVGCLGQARSLKVSMSHPLHQYSGCGSALPTAAEAPSISTHLGDSGSKLPLNNKQNISFIGRHLLGGHC